MTSFCVVGSESAIEGEGCIYGDKAAGKLLIKVKKDEDIFLMTPDFKSGFVAIIGRPNVGKSALEGTI